ncbi:MAG: helix-turn-helix domain-containing protein, partial [Planctomycetota bacterium]
MPSRASRLPGRATRALSAPTPDPAGQAPAAGVWRAAQALNLTQPAVTARLRNLELTLGTAIFDRSEGGNRLTKRG